ncbi:hypothetical protein PybrP1_006671 [[Pythium] brassicae (nom. inval.)]|nr:hypothetical protein PybrP1_006671 [[Pythium] brassicae (nom. inval.)]
MSKEGYLISHEDNARSAIFYCVLGEGRLQFFTKRHGGVLVRELALSRSKLQIRGVPDADARDCAFSFSVQLQRAKIKDGRLLVIGKPLGLLLSAPTWGERKAWGNAIHAWQRNYWGEPQHRAANMDDEELEVFFFAQRRALESALEAAAIVPSVASLPKSVSRKFGTARSPSSVSSPPLDNDDDDDDDDAAGSTARAGGAKSARAAAVSRMFFSRAQAVKSMGSTVGKKLRAKSSAVTFSLPPMGLSISSACIY